MTRIGVLALQGDFEAHARAFGELDVQVVEVRHTPQLNGLAGLVLPGGESTTLLNLMRDEPWFDALRGFHSAGGALMATCAGAILLSREVVDPAQPSVGLLDAVIRRNAYGRQIDSFEAQLEWCGRDETRLPAVFIRAPRFVSLGPAVQVRARHAGAPVLVREGSIMAATFHPELTSDRRLQREFLAIARGSNAAASSSITNERRVPC